MLISELSKRSGLPIDTLRFYEKKGLIDSEMVDRQTNNYRIYNEQSLERLVLIQQAKRLGFTLAEIQEWIASFESDRLTNDEKQVILNRKLQEVDDRLADLQQMRAYLAEKIDRLID
ncbi:MerR family transcriptional regulator [Chamaesiphon sp. VAR_69_metabat_338]|uniref:MerR family transcriptional regulator n=1 Tax=Chamaesiphon sp. VAR_69_metabat_338 TaxID=2964704 RepID=UPI00286E837C|nr:MerR family transcriptional regulator [Chamaesiphon sp. VAR_69_metabat_338]